MAQWVLFVPGFAASTLLRKDDGGDRETKIWLDQLEIGFSGIGDLDTDPEVSPANLDRVRPGSPLYEVYFPFYGFLARAGLPVWQWGYDWRADVATNGQRLANAINDERTSEAEFTIVAHSMGGLVAASAVNRLTDSARTRVKRVITCGTPWRGSYRALQMFAGTHETVQTIVGLNVILSRRNRREWTRDTLRVLSSWPGLYDLLPMPELMVEYPPGPGADFADAPWLSDINPWYTNAKRSEAVARRPINFEFPPEVHHENLRGVGRPTLGPSPVVLDGKVSWWPEALYGDGTVPELSSLPPVGFNSRTRDFDAEHEQFMSFGPVQSYIGRLMGVL